MPTYQYACTMCDDRLEVVQKFSDEPMTECSSCGGRLRKVFSPVGVVFKGSGFYRTDSRAADGNGSTSSSKESKADSTGSNGGSSGSSNGSESAGSGASSSGGEGSSSSGSNGSSSNTTTGDKQPSGQAG